MSFYNGILNHDDTHGANPIILRGLPGVGFKLTKNNDFDLDNKKLTNVQSGDDENDVMTKQKIENYVSNKTQYLDGALPTKVTSNKAVIYSNTGSIHSNSLYLKDQYGQETIFHNEDQDDNQIRLYIPNLKNNDSFGGRLKSSIMVTSIDQTIEGKKIFHDIQVPTPTIDGHASNKAYVDNEISNAIDNFNYVEKSGDTMIGPLIVPKDNYPVQGDLNKVISYETQREIFLSKREGGKMLQPIDMNGFSIDNLPLPTANDHACNKVYVDNKVNSKADRSDLDDYMKLDGSKVMTGNLNLNNKKIINVAEPYLSSDCANKVYVTKVVNHLPTMFLDRLGNSSMLGNLNMNQKRISNLQNPIQSFDAVTLKFVSDMFLDRHGDSMMLGDIKMNNKRILDLAITAEKSNEATSKKYVDDNIKRAQIKHSHILENEFKYIMSTLDEISSEYGVEVDKIDNYENSFHNYNKQVIYLKLIKDNNEYDARIGYNIYKLVNKEKNKIYTTAIEWLTNDNNIWTKMEIFNNITAGSILSNHTEKFSTGDGLYYTRSIVQFEVFSITTPPVYLLSTIRIKNVNPTYPNKFKEIYNIIYGCSGILANIDREVYDNHNSFKIEKTKMIMLVPLDMNNKHLLNVSNTASINMYGTIINKYFTISSTQDIIINIGPFFLEKIILYTSNKFRSQQDTMTINTGKTSKYPINYPARPGNVIIQINKYYDRISTIKMTIANNIHFRIIYRVFY